MTDKPEAASEIAEIRKRHDDDGQNRIPVSSFGTFAVLFEEAHADRATLLYALSAKAAEVERLRVENGLLKREVLSADAIVTLSDGRQMVCASAVADEISSLTAHLARCREAFETREKKDGVTLSTHALYNLEGAIIDIERQGKADAVSLRTLKRVASQLAEIDRALAPTTGDGR